MTTAVAARTELLRMRLEFGLSRRQMALGLGLSARTIERRESGDRPIPPGFLDAVRDFLGDPYRLAEVRDLIRSGELVFADRLLLIEFFIRVGSLDRLALTVARAGRGLAVEEIGGLVGTELEALRDLRIENMEHLGAAIGERLGPERIGLFDALPAHLRDFVARHAPEAAPEHEVAGLLVSAN